MKARVITARLNEDVSREIEFIKSSLNMMNTTAVVTQAIHLLYTITKEKQMTKSSLQLFEESGLLGCMEGASDLSNSYKEEISKVIRQKYVQNKVSSKKSRIRHDKSA